MEEGQMCGVDGCQGIIRFQEPENCSCHLHPPCSSCLNLKLYCPVCQRIEDEKDEEG